MNIFLKDTIERAIKTAAETGVATIGTTTLIGEINWKMVASTIGVATILSVFSSIASRPIGDKKTASLITKENN